jgi:hypothetical protein
MELMFQIAIGVAAGILLAYAVIQWRHFVIRLLKIMGVLLGLGALVIISLLAFQSYWPSLSARLPSIIDAATKIGVILGVVLALFGSWALWKLFLGIINRQQKPLSENDPLPVIMFYTILAGVPIYLLAQVSPFSGFASNLNDWSRSSGYQDFVPVFVFQLLCLWPLIPLAVFTKFGAGSNNARVELDMPNEPE